jgi:AraC-like DNA-binding protein
MVTRGGSRILQRAGSLEELQSEPFDRYIGGASWLVFFRTSLSGTVLWGHLDGACLTAVAQAASTPRDRKPAPLPCLIDLRHVASIDPAMLAVRGNLLVDFASTISRFVTRVAVLHSGGMIGATAMGIRELAPPPVAEKFFQEPLDALRWLEREDEAPLLLELDQLRAEAAGPTPFLRELRASLDAKPRMTLQEAADARGMRERSLQRQLAEAGTTFQQERLLATVRAAQRQLLATGASVAEIAAELGCASPQHLSTVFRKFVGESPASWRRRHLADPDE